ncbi:glycine/sarcosine N-methyltransferase [Saccharopolyspora erythraea NRRL 2338]|uniref:Glycine sarcosine N-methyltransferase n=2 Tax=Saccharopolyspora erythraea TaxID=1836 RepID=A4FGJ7_SACEN|nr:class I SAM-dependent methyltransferase [Saccharopolyspora erythraea]EQD83504.1 SAM-dependent methyltransferase [Saccharopolyspora erythraea D]PFG96876.1 glycine/sarcosine N-methyltransferase [Saccharopolyspora erythraea NRRL 2338]QRK87112.1 methyltransferase domain-containing protein [Saccharopolyspora erythraea]CAM03172.1 glycine sarcosine N-methyltransferase [Saccharopolyspora erythraea NRRL 2338]
MAKSVDDLARSEGTGPIDGTADLVAREEQVFGDNPLEVRESDHYTHEYVGGFVDKWDELIDWKKRYESEGSFFIDQLKARGVRSVLDVATGTGFHSVRLLEEGFEAVSADGSPQMLAKAFSNGLTYGGHILRVVHADWRWLNRDVHGEYDAIICLGNSFTHLFSERDRRKALAEFYAMLKHDGVLIIDQRNYDSILDTGFSSKHTYYYAGDDVSAEPDYIDDGLARFKYTFPDKSEFYLNMYPLRKNYMRRLMREVGFQRIDTYGDFQETYKESEPDFFIHVAEKNYRTEEQLSAGYSSAVSTARDYYNSEDADNFYFHVWGGNDIHVGLYQSPDEDIDSASRRTVERMAAKVRITPETRVLDIGAGYGGAARHLARTYGCKVACLNLSEVENARNIEFNRAEGLDELIEVKDGSFEDIPYEDNAFDIVWSQDAILHSGDRERVLEEVTRVLKGGGSFVFTDPMAADGARTSDLGPILDRLHLDTMGSPGFYRRELARLGLQTVDFEDLSEYLPVHYGRVLEVLESREQELSDRIGEDYRNRMKTGLRNWVEAGNAGNLAWGIFHAQS